MWEEQKKEQMDILQYGNMLKGDCKWLMIEKSLMKNTGKQY